MLMRVVFLPQAERDLEAIGGYIAHDNPRRAVSFLAELRVACRTIASAPKAYRLRPELGKGIRSCVHGSYVIFFLEAGGVVRIVRVLHGAMDIKAQFQEEDPAPDGNR